ncbi:GDSL-type esterase/lipase family protein [Sphingomonas sp. H160509]|uniref:GDSL-type esterase/lipase family protein n=1 Tax=Sphingomonas sp. H160509 TaxID=2955313 RepID=UPI0021E7C0DB|nr:GDSL-type esterase/lipase family protein [Sphingomonas sp. H160509]MDD1451203.1 GDSL-type esterase/lipase family protein [Sphingomonas sp. H160509]
MRSLPIGPVRSRYAKWCGFRPAVNACASGFPTRSARAHWRSAVRTSPGRPPPGTPRIEGGARLTFSGRSDAVIPPGAEMYSDPVALHIAAGADLAISLYLPDAASPQTGHPGSRATSFTLAGNAVADGTLAGATPTTHWYALADVEVAATPTAGTIVAIGDSITDGYGVKPERNTRWTDVLAQRLRGTTAKRAIGVVNAGIGGNRVLLDGLGPNLLARFDRDVIARSGVRWAIVLEGINDLGVLTREAPATPAQHAAIVAQITAGFAQVVARAHAHGIKVIGGTVMPFGGNTYYHPIAENEADRQAVNSFIRTSGVFDAVIDFDRLMRDPAHPDRLSPAYDSGDHLHPSEAGYKTMGEAVPLSLFGDSRASARSRSVIGATAPVPVGPSERGVAKGPAIAITFDDIPAHGPLVPGQTRVDVIRAITGALAAAKAPAFGFLNAGFGLDAPDDAAGAIAAWRAAGLPLGNHTYSHANLDKVGAAAFSADVVRNEAPLAAAAKGTDWHWFRYPFLSEGSTPAVRDAARADLRARGYRVAAVTMSFNDFSWNPVYAACSIKRDAGGDRQAGGELSRRCAGCGLGGTGAGQGSGGTGYSLCPADACRGVRCANVAEAARAVPRDGVPFRDAARRRSRSLLCAGGRTFAAGTDAVACRPACPARAGRSAGGAL